jgi:hypothetical protein
VLGGIEHSSAVGRDAERDAELSSPPTAPADDGHRLECRHRWLECRHRFSQRQSDGKGRHRDDGRGSCGDARERRQHHSQQMFIACMVVGDHSFLQMRSGPLASRQTSSH